MPIFGSSSKTSPTSTEASIKEKSKKSTTAATREEQTQTGTQRALSTEATEIFENLLANLAGKASGDGSDEILFNEITSLARTGISRAAGGDAEIQSLIDPIIAQQRANVGRDVRTREARLAGVAGSALSSNVQQLSSLFRNEAESSLAATEGQLRLAGRAAVTDELTSAASLAAGALDTRNRNIVEQMALVGDILKGVVVSSEATTTGQTTSAAQTIESLIKELTERSSGGGSSTSLGAGSSALEVLNTLSAFK
jgi:hypothetical protein